MKLTLYYRATASPQGLSRRTKSVDIQTLIHRNEPNRPHISSVTINFKEQHPEDKYKTDAPISQRARLKQSFQMPQSILSVPPVSPSCLDRLSGPSRLSLQPVQSVSTPSQLHILAAGRGGSKYNHQDPQPKNQANRIFPQKKSSNITKTMT